MGLFSKSKKTSTPPAPQPVNVGPGDLPEFAARLAAVERAMGGPDAPLRAAVRSLAEGAGGFDPWRVFELGLKPDDIKRPWRWFERACEVANAQGDHTLAPRMFVFLSYWLGLEGKATINDYADMYLDPAPPQIARAIARAAAEALGHLPGGQDVIPAARETLTVDQIRPAAQAAAA